MTLIKIYKIKNAILRRYKHRRLYYSQKKEEEKLICVEGHKISCD